MGARPALGRIRRGAAGGGRAPVSRNTDSVALRSATESVFLLTLDGVAAPVHVSHRYLSTLREKLPEAT